MSNTRIAALEREVAQLRSDMRRMNLGGGLVHRRQPRLGRTVKRYEDTPQYPTAPKPATYDPTTGITTPGDPHPDTFGFVFTEADFDDTVTGRIPVSHEDRQDASGGKYFGVVHNLCGVYIPEGTDIPIFEDNGYFWTMWNGTTSSFSTGTTPPPAISQLQQFVITASIRMRDIKFNVLGAPDDPGWDSQYMQFDLCFPSTAALNDAGLFYDSASKRLVALRDVSYNAVFSTFQQLNNYSSGSISEQATLEFYTSIDISKSDGTHALAGYSLQNNLNTVFLSNWPLWSHQNTCTSSAWEMFAGDTMRMKLLAYRDVSITGLEGNLWCVITLMQSPAMMHTTTVTHEQQFL